MNRHFSDRDAALHLRYGPGCILEGTFAIWLLIHADSYRPFGIWIAYFLLAMAAACLLTGFLWYLCWAYERGATPWYLAGVASLIGAVCVGLDRLFVFGFEGWDVALSFSFHTATRSWCASRFGAPGTARPRNKTSLQLPVLANNNTGGIIARSRSEPCALSNISRNKRFPNRGVSCNSCPGFLLSP